MIRYEATIGPSRVSDRDPPKSPHAVEHSTGEEGLRRQRLMAAVEQLAPEVGVAAACAGLGVSRASYYRAQQPQTGQPQ